LASAVAVSVPAFFAAPRNGDWSASRSPLGAASPVEHQAIVVEQSGRRQRRRAAHAVAVHHHLARPRGHRGQPRVRGQRGLRGPRHRRHVARGAVEAIERAQLAAQAVAGPLVIQRDDGVALAVELIDLLEEVAARLLEARRDHDDLTAGRHTLAGREALREHVARRDHLAVDRAGRGHEGLRHLRRRAAELGQVEGLAGHERREVRQRLGRQRGDGHPAPLGLLLGQDLPEELALVVARQPHPEARLEVEQQRHPPEGRAVRLVEEPVTVAADLGQVARGPA
jgi:hypothetical protein